MTSVRNFVLATLALCMLATPALADSHAPNAGAKALDAFLVRPASFIGSVVSTGFFIGTLGLTAPTGLAPDVGVYLMATPWRFTIARPIGDFNSYQDDLDYRGYAKEAPGITRAKRREIGR